MAILITSDSVIKKIDPIDNRFSLKDFSDIVKNHLAPKKIGYLYVIYGNNSKEQLNEIATLTFSTILRGNVMVIPVQQMPKDFDEESENHDFTSDEVDAGLLLSIQTVMTYSEIMDNVINSNLENMKDESYEWIYDPHNKENDSIEEFFDLVYEYISQKKVDELKNCIILEDEDAIIKVKDLEDLISTLNQMITYYETEEEYEKCLYIQKIIKTIANEIT